MSTATISATHFTRHWDQARHAAETGPVFVTDHGKPAYVFMKMEDYYNLPGHKPKSLYDLMQSIPSGDFEFEPPRMGDPSY